MNSGPNSLSTQELEYFKNRAAPFLERLSIGGEYQLFPLPGDSENQVFHLQHEGKDLVLKFFAPITDAGHDPLANERAFYDHFQSGGEFPTALAIDWDTDYRIGLLTYLNGRKLRQEELNLTAIQQAVDFITTVNQNRETVATDSMPYAKGACFSIREHLLEIDQCLNDLRPGEDTDEKVRQFILDELSPTWASVRETIVAQCETGGLELDQAVDEPNRILSPGDFGLHNAIITPERELRFVDFDEGGWDDPARLICNMFCPPDLPIKHLHWDTVIEGFEQISGFEPMVAIRARVLVPAYQVKRSGLMMNEFVSEASGVLTGARRSRTRMVSQIMEARQLLISAKDGT